MSNGGTNQLRAIVAARVSVTKGAEKTSHTAQHESGVKHVRDQGWTVVGSVEDLDVSADKVEPFSRPDLAPWLTEEYLDEWDALVFTKVDRVFRSTYDCVQFAKWAKDHKKVLVFVDDGMSLDYRDESKKDSFESMMAEFFVYVGSFFAQIELNRFRQRALDTHAYLMDKDRWTGGIAPDGFRIIAHPSGKGKGLAIDEERQEILHLMAGKLFDGMSFNGIAGWLNDQGYTTNQDYQREPNKRKGIRWTPTEVIKVLTTPATQGVKCKGATRGKGREMVLDRQGNPVRLAPPIFDDETWKKIQDVVTQRQREPYRVHGASPLLGIAFCGTCGAKASQNIHTKSNGKVYRYYRCGRSPKACPNHRMPATEVEETVKDFFLAELGNEKVRVREFQKGEDHTEELDRITKTIESLREDRAMGLFASKDDEERYREQMQSLITRRTELEQIPGRKAGWVHRASEEIYSEVWKKADDEGKKKLLRDAGITIEIFPNRVTNVTIPEDMKSAITNAT